MARRTPPQPASFVLSAPDVAGLPDHPHVEVAFAGRSNVGKSSLLGRLLQAPSLVRTSRTPGRTQLLNLFMRGDAMALVDLPGYGFAKLSHTQRDNLAQMMRRYVARRALLRGLVVVLDARRTGGSALDQQMVAWALDHGRQVLLAITKSDLVPKTKQLHHARLLEKAMDVPPGCAVLCSSRSGAGTTELQRRLGELAP